MFFKPRVIREAADPLVVVEYDQGMTRIAITAAGATYLTVAGLPASSDPLAVTGYWVVIGYLVFSFLVQASFSLYARSSQVRRMITMITDHSATAWVLYSTGEAGAICFVIALWVTVGYGARYGTYYLYVGIPISLSYLAVIFHTDPFWLQHKVLSYSILVADVVIPAFVWWLLARLRRVKDEAELANATKTQFLANISHEIRTPLTGIIGAAQLLLSKPTSDANTRDNLENIESSARHLLLIVNDLLDISKMEAGAVELSRTLFSLEALLTSVRNVMEPLAQQKGLAFDVHIAADAPRVIRTDETRLRQVLLNLLSNAIKFTESGRVSLEVGWVPRGSASGNMSISVRDTGIGIPADALSSIFDRFAQADQHVTRQFGGSGLGMTIARQLVEMMDGTIDVRSQERVGTEFTVTLPVSLLPEEGPGVTETQGREGATFGSLNADSYSVLSNSGGAAKAPAYSVMVVEDNATVRSVLEQALKRIGFEIVAARDGSEALRLLDDVHVDLVVVDFHMPKISGADVIRRYREQHKHTAMPFILLTADLTSAVQELAQRLGVTLLSKPINFNALAAKITALVEAEMPAKSSNDPRPLTSNSEFLDHAVVQDVFSAYDNQSERRAVIDGFRDDAMSLVQQIERYHSNRDAEAVQRTAHTLKGLAATFGAKRLAAHCKGVEGSDAMPAPPISSDWMEEARAAVLRTTSALSAY